LISLNAGHANSFTTMVQTNWRHTSVCPISSLVKRSIGAWFGL
jgi:hypothetical protein